MRIRIPEDIPEDYNNQRSFGIEFEINLTSQENPLEGLHLAGLDVNSAETASAWTVKGDCSIRGFNCYEITTPRLGGLRGICELTKGIEWIAEHASVNRSCGLHIHHGGRDLGNDGLENLYYTYIACQEVINSVIPPSRRNNNYCMDLRHGPRGPDHIKEALKQPTIDKSYTLARLGRLALSFSRWPQDGRIEFRQHSGTVNRSKVLAWLFFSHALVNLSRESRIETPPANIEDLCNTLHLPANIVIFFKERCETIKIWKETHDRV